MSPVALALGLGALGWSPVAQAADTTFRHARHEAFTCTECHTMQGEHGALRVRDPSDCRTCHHVRERAERDCTACHESADLRNVVFSLERSVRFSVGSGVSEREFRFDHADHAESACVECHSGGATLAVPNLDCQRCHEEHHAPANSQCASCHEAAPRAVHTPEVHETCAGAGCHSNPPFPGPPPTRVGCLWCHEDQADHEPDGNCVDCHAVSGPEGASDLKRPT